MRILFAFTLIVIINQIYCAKLREVFAWQEVDYVWPSDQAKQEAISSNRYIIKNNLPLGLDKWKNKLFITVPRYVLCLTFN